MLDVKDMGVSFMGGNEGEAEMRRPSPVGVLGRCLRASGQHDGGYRTGTTAVKLAGSVASAAVGEERVQDRRTISPSRGTTAIQPSSERIRCARTAEASGSPCTT